MTADRQDSSNGVPVQTSFPIADADAMSLMDSAGL